LCKWDKNDRLRFATLDSKTGQAFFKENKIDPKKLESVVFWIPKHSFALGAQATFELFKTLGGGFRVISLLRILPKFITKGVYKIIARNRYRWFGKFDACPLPNRKYIHKFLV
jgi:predicted DCC family thiol-disulfide oxidoreductase YuxK